MSTLSTIRVLLMMTAAATVASADSYRPLEKGYSWNIYIDLETSGGWGFMPIINAATMEPFQFALAPVRNGDPGVVDGTPYSPAWVTNAMSSYGGMFGSGASPFLIFADYKANELDAEIAMALPRYFPAPPFEIGEAPPWDPDNPPPVDSEIIFDPITGEEISGGEPDPLVEIDDPTTTMGMPKVILDGPGLDFTVPEPSTILTGGAGIAILAMFQSLRRRRAK